MDMKTDLDISATPQTGGHPWHLHGATFQVIARSGEGEGYYDGGHLTPPHPNPVRRDTVQINAGGFVALRFKANNPGIHLMHCHIEWHVEAGESEIFPYMCSGLSSLTDISVLD